jgi:DNA repair photolyase
MKIEELEAKTILVPSKLPDTDFVCNPYTGCAFACGYCYASFMGRFVGETIGDWGNYVYVKTNAVTLLERELARWSSHRREASILLSSVTDPYQGVEARYRLTRGILEVLAREQYPGPVAILTKSPLVLRDRDILQEMPRVTVGLTVTTTDDNLSRFLEVHAPASSLRLKALEQLHAAGIDTYAFVGPLLPHFRYHIDQLDVLFASLAKAGTRSVYVEHINLSPYIRRRLSPVIANLPPEQRSVYDGASTLEHRTALDNAVAKLLDQHGLQLRLQHVIYHHSVTQASKR